jgi:hypothetical protein
MKITRSQLKQLIAEELNVGVPTAAMEEEIDHLASYEEGPRELLDTPHQIGFSWHDGWFGVTLNHGEEVKTNTIQELLTLIESEPDDQMWWWKGRTENKERTLSNLNGWASFIRAFLN